MKLFAPRNDGGWSMTDPTSWWPLLGSHMTTSGKPVSEDKALTFSAVCACTRVISETLARIPMKLLEQVDARTTKSMTSHPLWNLLRHAPNPEQDKACWFDMLVAMQLNWGNAYAEIVRDQTGAIAQLWPIHSSRIPIQNITRNETDPYETHKIVVGQPGEIVYWVRNDDASLSPIPASDMLHVPGVLSANGITGQSLVRLGANSIGIGLSTEEHAGALFKNGALTNMVIKSPKILGKESADRLRAQWQSMFGGVSNHYKTLLLEEGMEPFPITMNPQDTQLILARQFSVTEIARWYRVPPHMIGDLTRATFSNIEQQTIDFYQNCIDPWFVRWQEALFRQLLTPEEKRRLFFEFDRDELLRGDSAARSAYFQFKFNTGAASPNDIRAADRENPVEGGDTYFVQGNNYIPLDKAQEMAQANIDKAKAPPPAPQKPAEAATQPAVDYLPQFIELSRAIYEHAKEDREAIAEVALRAKSTSDAIEAQGLIRIEQNKRIDEAFAPISTLAGRIDQLVDVQKSSDALAKKIDAVPALIKAAVIEAQPAAPEPPDTRILEQVAVREAEMLKKQSENDEKQQKEREITDKVLILSLRRSIDNLVIWEWKAIEKAIDKPLEWADWRAKFYHRFCKEFVADLSEFVADAEACGVTLDVAWAADCYVGQSISDLRTLDGAAKDNFQDRIKECCDHFRKRQWTERSKVLSAELVERGRKTFNERQPK